MPSQFLLLSSVIVQLPPQRPDFLAQSSQFLPLLRQSIQTLSKPLHFLLQCFDAFSLVLHRRVLLFERRFTASSTPRSTHSLATAIVAYPFFWGKPKVRTEATVIQSVKARTAGWAVLRKPLRTAVAMISPLTKEVVAVKKTTMVVTVLAVLAVAGTALAWNGGCGMGGMPGKGGPECLMMNSPMGAGCGGCGEGSEGPGHRRGPGAFRSGKHDRGTQLPAELQAKVQEMRKARLQLQLLLMEDKVDEAKAREVFQKMQGLRNQMAEWRFNEMLKKQGQPTPNP